VGVDAAGNAGSDQVTVTAVSGPVPDLGETPDGGAGGDASGASGDGGPTLRGEDGCSTGPRSTAPRGRGAAWPLPPLLLLLVGVLLRLARK